MIGYFGSTHLLTCCLKWVTQTSEVKSGRAVFVPSPKMGYNSIASPRPPSDVHLHLSWTQMIFVHGFLSGNKLRTLFFFSHLGISETHIYPKQTDFADELCQQQHFVLFKLKFSLQDLRSQRDVWKKNQHIQRPWMGGSQEHKAHSYMQPVFLQPDTFPPALEMSATHNERRHNKPWCLRDAN